MRKEPCTESKIARNKRSYQKKRDEHRCVCCGKPDERTLRGLAYCKECTERHRANASPRKKRTPEQNAEENQNKREWHARCKELQICIRCGNKDKRTVNGLAMCAICAAKANMSHRRNYDVVAMRAYGKARRDAWREQGRCTYCGGKKEDADKRLCIDCQVRARLRYAARQRKKAGRDD